MPNGQQINTQRWWEKKKFHFKVLPYVIVLSLSLTLPTLFRHLIFVRTFSPFFSYTYIVCSRSPAPACFQVLLTISASSVGSIWKVRKSEQIVLRLIRQSDYLVVVISLWNIWQGGCEGKIFLGLCHVEERESEIIIGPIGGRHAHSDSVLKNNELWR